MGHVEGSYLAFLDASQGETLIEECCKETGLSRLRPESSLDLNGPIPALPESYANGN